MKGAEHQPEAVSILEFVKTGRLGPVGPGIDESTVRELWGEPTDSHLTRPQSLSYGPVMLFLRADHVTHCGVYLEDLDSPGPPGFIFDVPVDSVTSFRRAVDSAGLHFDRAEDETNEGEPEVVLRIKESNVLALFDANGRLSCLTGRARPWAGPSSERAPEEVIREAEKRWPRDVPDEQHIAEIMAETGGDAEEARATLDLLRGDTDVRKLIREWRNRRIVRIVRELFRWPWT